MKKFDVQVKHEQVAWRKKFMPDVTECGSYKGRLYDHLLAPEDWEKNLWPEIAGESKQCLSQYLHQHGIQKHDGSHHLNSSWTLCANLYFPFRRSEQDMQILAGFLRKHVISEIAIVENIELEFELPGSLHPSVLLGEMGGGRGRGQTSPDVAFQIRMQDGSEGLILTESKYSEHWFYQCSACRQRKSSEREPNPDCSRCLDIRGLLASPSSMCHQYAWGRRYWDWLAVNEPLMKQMKCCPAARGGYQLLRQQALAEGVAASGKYGFVASCVAYDHRNTELKHSMHKVGIQDFTDGWGQLFSGKAKFATFTHQDWVAWVRTHALAEEWQAWSDYMRNRYGY